MCSLNSSVFAFNACTDSGSLHPLARDACKKAEEAKREAEDKSKLTTVKCKTVKCCKVRHTDKELEKKCIARVTANNSSKNKSSQPCVKIQRVDVKLGNQSLTKLSSEVRNMRILCTSMENELQKLEKTSKRYKNRSTNSKRR